MLTEGFQKISKGFPLKRKVGRFKRERNSFHLENSKELGHINSVQTGQLI